MTMLVTAPDSATSQIVLSYVLHAASLPSAHNQEKIKHLHYLNDFRTLQCPLFLDHKCQVHRPFACFYWHFPNQRRRRPIKKPDGTFNYNPDVYCTVYDENTGVCPNGEDCQYVHRNAGDTERRYHPRYFKTGQCIYETADNGSCVKNGQHCAFAHGIDDLRQPVYDVREVSDAVEHIANLPATLEKERVLSEDPQWNDMLYVLAFYKTHMCKKPPRMCRQGYACPFYHNGKDRRRNPHVCRYRSTPCPQVKPSGDEWKDSGQCEAQDECVYCHTRTEQQFHPEIYKSTKCNDMAHDGFCPRGPFCAFAHSETESTIGRDFLTSPALVDDLVHEHSYLSSSKEVVTTDSALTQALLFNASVTNSQLGLGMMGLSALSSSTLNYIQSLLTAQSQIIQQYATIKQTSSLQPVSTPTASLSSSMPPYRLSSACSSDSGLSTTKEDLHCLGTTENITSPDKDTLDRTESEEKFPNINLILSHALGESFNCCLNEVNSLPDRNEADYLPEYSMFDDKYSMSNSNDSHQYCHRHGDHAEEEDICTELGQFTSTSAPLNIPVNKNFRGNLQQDFGSRNWASQPQSMGSPGGSSGFGDSVPFTHSRFIDQNTNCRSANANSPASRMPQSPIMIQSPFNNAACDLEKLMMEKELHEVKSKLTDTEKELHNIRHQRDIVLLQLQQSWKLIQTLVGNESVSSSEEKENVHVLSELSKMSFHSSSSSSSPEQSTSLRSGHSTCTLTD